MGKARVAHNLLGFSGATTVGHHDPSCTGFEWARVGPVVTFANTGHRFNATSSAAQRHIKQMIVAVVLVLHVDPDAVKIEHADHLGEFG